MAQPIITQDLKNTVAANPRIAEVHFDAQGRHYLYAHELIEKEGEKKKALYGHGTFSHKQVIPGKTNVDQLKEDIAKGIPDTKIVSTMSRDEVLAYKIAEVAKDSLLDLFLNASPEEKAAFIGAVTSAAQSTPKAAPVPEPKKP